MLNQVTSEMSKKKAFFDSSIVIGLRKQELNIDLNEEFPEKDWLRLAQDTITDECWIKGNWQQRKETAKFFEDNKFNIISSTHALLVDEYLNGSNFSTYLKSNQTEILSFLKGEHPKQKEFEELYSKMYDDRTVANNDEWNSIPISDDDVVIYPQKIYDRMSWLLSNDIPFSMPIDDQQFLRIRAGKVFLSSKRSIIEEKKHIRIFSDFKKELPLTYNILVYSIFIDCLMRPYNIYKKKTENRRESFEIKLDDCTEKVLISSNLLPDFRISLPALHFCDLFATGDRHQVNLIKYLYPQYSNKIKLFHY